jgi:hypothetical protein
MNKKLSRTLALALAIAAAGTASAGGSASSSARSGALHVTKECSEYFGRAGEFCTITSSNIPQIKTGMKVVYLAPLGADLRLDTDIVLSFEHGSAANGHVVLDAVTADGRVTFAGGTGKFAGFQADVDVSVESGVWHWDGTYSFSPPGR